MNKSVQGTKCSTCMHRDVCSLKEEYFKLVDTLPEVSEPFRISINCPHYRTCIIPDITNKFWTDVNSVLIAK